MPWDAICTLLSQCIYGGKIDNEFDQVCANLEISLLKSMGNVLTLLDI